MNSEEDEYGWSDVHNTAAETLDMGLKLISLSNRQSIGTQWNQWANSADSALLDEALEVLNFIKYLQDEG